MFRNLLLAVTSAACLSLPAYGGHEPKGSQDDNQGGVVPVVVGDNGAPGERVACGSCFTKKKIKIKIKNRRAKRVRTRCHRVSYRACDYAPTCYDPCGGIGGDQGYRGYGNY